MKTIPLLRVFALLLTVLPMALHAQIPQRINDGGCVIDGTTNFNGSGQFKFALINAAGPTNHLSNNGSSFSGSQPTAAVPLTRTKRLDSVLRGEISLPNMMNVIRRDSFSIRQGELVRFTQPGTSSELLIIVTGDLPTEIAGRLLSNGRIAIVNPHGIFIRSYGEVDTGGGFLATTCNSPGDRLFSAHPITFEGSLGVAVTNAGRIFACHGDVSLIGHTVENQGTITGSNVFLSSGKGQTTVSGSVTAGNTRQGGRIDIQGGTVELSPRARIDASGTHAGGSVRIGGGLRGDDGEIANARTTTIAAGSVISADARDCGDGGSVVVWADGATSFNGHISARGGNDGGDGGFAEVSGKQWLGFSGTVDLSAHTGNRGTLLLDPARLVIQASDPDLAGNGSGLDVSGNIAAGDFAGANSVITSGRVATLLATANLSLAATDALIVSAPIAWNSGFSLTLEAGNSITVYAAMSNGGSGNIVFNSPGNIILGNNVTTGGSQTYNGPVFLFTNSILTSTGSGAIWFKSTLNGGRDLTVTTAGYTTFGGAVGNTHPLASLTVNGGGWSVVGGGTILTTGAQNYNKAVVLTKNTVLTGTAVTFGSYLTGAGNNMRINAPVTIVGNTLNGGPASGVGLFTAGGNTNVRETTTFAGSYNFINPVTLAGNWTVTGSAVTFGSSLIGAANNLSIIAPVALSGNTLNGGSASGVVLFTAGWGHANVQGTTTFAGSYNFIDPVTLSGDWTLTGSQVTFGSTLSGAFSLTVNSPGATTFGGAVDVAGLLTNSGGTTAINGGMVTTTGGQTYNDAVTLGANATFNAGAGPITFASTVDGLFSLTANTTGATTFGGAVGGTNALTTLTTNADGTTAINGGSVTTSAAGGQVYGDAVTLGANTVLNSGAGGSTSAARWTACSA
jgi:filamentous hemagglutinin family protein